MTLEPIVREIHVRIEPADAFRLFTTEMGTWWPLETHSRIEEGQTLQALVFEEHVGGRIYELMTDGAECDWGTVTSWEPGTRLLVDWKPNDDDRPPTELQITFTRADDGGTMVRLSHRGWELLGPALGMQARDEYDSPMGWSLAFEKSYADAAGIVS
jgi:uncharacterized protein YndB with AHSA1/START domain